MTIEEYKEQTAALGISRGALAEGFSYELPGVASIGREPHVFFDNKGDIVKPELPDYSHLNPPQHEKGKKGGATKKNRGNGGAARGSLPAV